MAGIYDLFAAYLQNPQMMDTSQTAQMLAQNGDPGMVSNLFPTEFGMGGAKDPLTDPAMYSLAGGGGAMPSLNVNAPTPIPATPSMPGMSAPAPVPLPGTNDMYALAGGGQPATLGPAMSGPQSPATPPGLTPEQMMKLQAAMQPQGGARQPSAPGAVAPRVTPFNGNMAQLSAAPSQGSAQRPSLFDLIYGPRR